MKKTFLTILILVICSLVSKSEDYNLTLDESINIAKSKSYSMLRLMQDFKIAEYNLKSATSKLKTHIDLTFKTPQYSEEVRNREEPDGQLSFYSVKQISYAGNLTIRQPLPTDGNIYIENDLYSSENMKSNLRSSELETRIRLNQPLNAFWYNSIKATLKRAQLAYEQSGKALKREELNLIYRVSSSYYNLLLLQKSAEIAHSDLERQTEAFEISKNKYEAGLIREVDALQMEVDLAEAQSNYDIAILRRESAVNSFKELLGINLDDNISLNSDLEYKFVIVDPEQAVRFALENRLEIREQEIQIELQQLTVKQQKSAGMIQGDIDAYWGKYGYDQKDYYVSFSKSIENSYDYYRRNSSYGIGLTIKIPILDWGENKALVRAAESRLKQYTLRKEEVEREIETEVRNLAASVNSNLKRLQLLEKNVSVAEKSFEITRQRFSDGDIDSQALALERNRLNTAYTSHLSAYINYQLTLADLMQKTFYDFLNEKKVDD